MTSVVNVQIHASQFPRNVRRDLLESLRTRRVNHKFHYDSVRQTQKWLALHQAHSPSRNDANCAATYDRAFAGAARQIKSKRVHLIGLGCGGGQKDTRLLALLKARRKTLSYTPSDVSVAMTLVAREAALAVVPETSCVPLVCDLATANDLTEVFLRRNTEHATRLITFFGMIPNFEPQVILPRLANVIQRDDWLLFSANLAPGSDYATGMKRILPQYDNELTRDWLMAFLLDLGIAAGDGALRFSIEGGRLGLKRVVARFHFCRRCRIAVEVKQFEFRAGEFIQLFYSYRYTPERVRDLLGRHGVNVLDQWITQPGEEGVFLCRRPALPPR
jgi:L-histidine Nalpha-methyltransferase